MLPPLVPQAREVGINADYQHIGDYGAFYDFAEECGSAVLIGDLKREGLVELRRRNSKMVLQQRDYYFGWEGKWRDCPYKGAPQEPERMFDVLTSGYRSELKVWIYFGNEPARGNKDINELILDIAFYVKVIELFIAAKIRVVVMNIQVVELTPDKLKYYEPIFDLCNRHPEYVAFGIHEYFTMILPLGIGTGDWSKLLKKGDFPRDPKLWPKSADLVANSVEAHIGKDVWLRNMTKQKYPNMRIFKNEMGFDRINNLADDKVNYIETLDAQNGGRRIRGLDTIIALLYSYFGDDGQTVAGDMVTWMCQVANVSEVNNFYNWSTQSEWLDYSCAPYAWFRQVILHYNHRVRTGQFPTQETPPVSNPPPTTPPVIVTPPKRSTLEIAADLQKLVNELKAV